VTLAVVFLGGDGTDYAERPPPPALAPWVHAAWSLRARRPIDLRVLPDGCIDIIAGRVVGPFTSAVVVPMAADADAPDPLAEAAMRARDLGALARDAGYSPRHLRRRLLLATGLGPKRLQRIGRMQRALTAGRGESWARTAVEQGWHDEAHMANDVGALAGATPHALLGTPAA